MLSKCIHAGVAVIKVKKEKQLSINSFFSTLNNVINSYA